MVQFSKPYWLVIGIMLLTLGIHYWIRSPQKVTEPEVDLQDFPKQLEGWVSQEYPLHERVEQALRTDKTLLRFYTDSSGRRIELFVGYYRDQKLGAQVHSPQHCLPGSGWTILRNEDLRLPWETSPAYAKKLHIVKGGDHQLVVYWFQSGGSLVQNEFELKARLVMNAFKQQATSVFFYRLSIPFTTHRENEALETLKAFLAVAGIYLNHRAENSLAP